MTDTTTDLITGAYYAAGVVSREFETVSGSQLQDGLGWLNDILTEKRVDEGMIPYETVYTFPANVGQEIYFIPDLIQIDTLVFYLDEVRYAMAYDKRNQYFGMPRVQNVQTLPYDWYFERVTGGGNLYIYFFPDQRYPFEVHGIFGLKSVELGQDLSASVTTANLGVPTFYSNTKVLVGSQFVPQVALAPGQLVISTTTNGLPLQSQDGGSGNQLNFSVDLAGSYQNIGALVNYINTGILPGINARIDVNDFVLYSITEPPNAIYVQSAGYPPTGTQFIGNVAAATTGTLGASAYNNGNLGIGATLTAPVPNVTLFMDGYVVQLGDRVLIKNQADPIQNGSYIMTQQASVTDRWILTRTTNYDQAQEIEIGTLFTVVNGGTNKGLTFVETSEVGNIGADPITFALFGAITFSNFSTVQQANYQVFNASGFDQFYRTYLRYALADRICAEYNYVTPPNVLRQLGKYESWINKRSRVLDLRNTKASTLQKRGNYNWAFINLGRGWVSNS